MGFLPSDKSESHWDLDKQTADNLVWAEGEKQQ